MTDRSEYVQVGWMLWEDPQQDEWTAVDLDFEDLNYYPHVPLYRRMADQAGRDLHDVPLIDLVAELEHRGATRLVPHEVYIGSRHYRYGGTYSRPMTVLAVFTEGAVSGSRLAPLGSDERPYDRGAQES